MRSSGSGSSRTRAGRFVPLAALTLLGSPTAGGCASNSSHGPDQAAVSFIDSGADPGSVLSWNVTLGDADGDGDLDVFLSNWHYSNPALVAELWLNDGSGSFSLSGQEFPVSQHRLVPGDLDSDGDLDIWLGGAESVSDTAGAVWLNDGSGHFVPGSSGYRTGNAALADLDGDGDLDAWVTNYNQGSRIYLNDGAAAFTASTQGLNQQRTFSVGLGDLDGDGDADAWVVSAGDENQVDGHSDRVWFNDGAGIFTHSGQSLNPFVGIHCDFGDVDGDGDLDVVTANMHQAPDPALEAHPNRLWLNDGAGSFTPSDQDMGLSGVADVRFGDLDGDGDTDAVILQGDSTFDGRANLVLLNDGSGHFADSGLRLGSGASVAGALGDLDGDGDLDIFVANCGFGANKVWLNTTGENISPR